tara:strand:+ start:1233 stop:1787 length:555 start_codon:yes stop_codon:yes gene_type:complete
MNKYQFPSIFDIHTIVFDFDGVFTNNKVYTNQNGLEMIRCDKSDSLGINILKNFIKKNDLDLDIFVLSKEENPVVKTRCNKMKLKCFSGINNKLKYLHEYLNNDRINEMNNPFQGLIYLGNDLNDLEIMSTSCFAVAPNNGHELIKKISNVVLKHNGGEGFVREFVEELIPLNKEGVSDLLSIL